MPVHGGIFSPGVCCFRGPEEHGYPFLEQPFYVSVISVSAVYRPALTSSGNYDDSDHFDMHNKIISILRVARHYRIRHLVLSAFGCGAYRNPPGLVAEMFFQAFQHSEFLGHFAEVRFAILEDHNSQGRNFDAFREVFQAFDARGVSSCARSSEHGHRKRRRVGM